MASLRVAQDVVDKCDVALARVEQVEAHNGRGRGAVVRPAQVRRGPAQGVADPHVVLDHMGRCGRALRVKHEQRGCLARRRIVDKDVATDEDGGVVGRHDCRHRHQLGVGEGDSALLHTQDHEGKTVSGHDKQQRSCGTARSRSASHREGVVRDDIGADMG